MNGVDILESYYTDTPTSFDTEAFLISLAITLSIGIIITAIIWIKNEWQSGFISLILVISISIVISLIIGAVYAIHHPNENNNGTLEYKVIVDDTVSLNEFYEKYKIVRQEGKIFVVQEK